MRPKMKLTPKPTPALKAKTVFIYTTASIAVFGVFLWLTFLVLNVGRPEDALAAGGNYTSNKSGNWTTGSTWNGGTAPSTAPNGDNITLNSNHTVTLSGLLNINNNTTITINSNATLVINGDMEVNNSLILMINGKLIVNGTMDIKNNAVITINGGGGNLTTAGDVIFGNNTNMQVDGTMNIGGSLSFGNNTTFAGNGTVTVTGTGCSNWQGPGNCNDNITLPIELISFVAESATDGVKLTWKTATELNNNFFSIERSADGTTYTTVTTVSGKGTTKTVSSYEYTDTEPLSGRSYYRLSQTDFDGKMEVFNPVAVDFTGTAKSTISVYPNPVKGSTVNVRFSDPKEGSIEIVDGRGNKVLSEAVDGFSDNAQLTLNTNLQPGIYYLNYRTATSVETVKLIKQQ